MQIADLMLERMGYRFDDGARAAFVQYLRARMEQPHFANARSVRNALDRARLRHASRLFGRIAGADRETLSTISAQDILASRVLQAAHRGESGPC